MLRALEGLDVKRFLGRAVWRLLAGTIALMMGMPQAGAWTSSSSAFGVVIRVEGEGWGSAARDEIETLLQAVADELVDGPSPVFDHPIVVTHGGDAPVALFERGPAGEHRIRLSARNRAWAQYAYQFGHELCHVMANHTAHGDDPRRRRHQWFEEALCEAAGLYVLRRMAVRWSDDAPYPSWEDYADVLGRYAGRLLAEPHRQLPDGQTPADWLRSRLPALSGNPYLRGDNEILANLLLQRFEQAPEHWAALYALNRHDAARVRDVGDYLREWRDHVPRHHRAFVAGVASMLGLAEVRPASDERNDPLQLTARATQARAN